eukprot:scaffold38204_cov153-Skeletonema_marinoi.AAC.1
MGDMSNMSEAARHTRLRQLSLELEKVAAKTEHSFKRAAAGIIGLTNQLKNVNLSIPVCVRPSAIDNTRKRLAAHMLENKSSMNFGRTKSACKTRKKKVNCRTCRDIFEQPPSVYMGHASNSKRCPFKDKIKKEPTEEVSDGDSFKDKIKKEPTEE